MAKSLLETFASLDTATKRILSDIDNPRLLALAALEIAELQAGADRLSAEHLVACLEAAGVATKKISITRSLSTAKTLVSSRKEEGEVFYKIMTRGKREIETILSDKKLSVVRIEKNQPRTARLELQEIFQNLNDVIRICDPYYGIRTLDALDLIPDKCSVKFLSVNTSDSPRKLAGALSDFKKERSRVELRIARKNAGIHDRYVVTNSEFIILGHGLKDIGGKESFLIKIEQSLAPDLIKETIRGFDDKWTNATVL